MTVIISKSEISFRRSSGKNKMITGRVVVYLFISTYVIFTSLPIIYMISTAFKPIDELFLFPPRFLVRNPTFKSFTDLVIVVSNSTVPFARYVFNSIIISTAIVAGTVVLSGMAAYGMEKHRFPGANFVFAVVIACLMFVPQITQIPTYMIVYNLGMLNTYWALIIPKLAVAYNLFLMKQFIEQIPNTLLESARIDGANEWTTFWKLVMPLLKPAWTTLVVLSFITNWNDYFTPLIFVQNQAMKTLPLALQTLAGGPGMVARSGAVAAATFFTTMPTIIIFVLMQKKVIQTMAHSGIKA